MIALRGVYENGKIILREKIKTDKPVDIIVTFLEEVEVPASRKMDLGKFSFDRAKNLLKGYTGSLSDAVLEERRSAI